MSEFLGVDTSNYTTSAAVYGGGKIRQGKKLLPVREGELGLRQSDAVFHHVQQLPEVLESVLASCGKISAAGVSARPRDTEGSYMPCFTVGVGTARAISQALKVPLHVFSHQAGHIAAALYSAGRLDLLGQRFLAFHVSGGTTEAVIAEPDAKQVLRVQIAASSLDLKGGQAVDRVGAMLGLRFPAGRELERLALESEARYSPKPSMKGCCCSLSGVENKCRDMLGRGERKEDVARFCLDYLGASLDAMCAALLKEYGNLPVLFAGGVMSNTILRDRLEQKYGAYFADPEYSSDNAAGIAVLTALLEAGL